MSNKTKVFEGEHNNKKMFTIYAVDEKGEKKDSMNRTGDDARNIFNFGIKKAKQMLNHVEELKQFVKENE